MLPIQNVTYTKCYLYKMLPIQNVTYTKSYLYQMLPRQSVLDEMLPYENVLYETLLIIVKFEVRITVEDLDGIIVIL